MLPDNTQEIIHKQNAIGHEVQLELFRQIEKWGIQNHSPERWISILVEEVGEVAMALNDMSEGRMANHKELAANYREELLQVAAVAIAAAENWDRS